MNGLGKSKILRLDDNEDLVVTAYAPVEGASDKWRKIAFKASLVDYVYEIDDKLSGIVLKSGVTIPVNMKFEQLRENIYQPDLSTGNGIDLTLVTGKAVGEVQRLRLSKTFNPAAQEQAPGKPAGVEIIMFARAQKTDREFRLVRVHESQIGYFEPSATRKETETYVQLKDGQSIDGWTDFYVPLQLDHFAYYLNQARAQGSGSLDLAETTRPKSTRGLTM